MQVGLGGENHLLGTGTLTVSAFPTQPYATIVSGDNLAIAGQVYALNDSLINVYLQRGFFDAEGRARLEGHSTFFLVDSLDFVFPEEGGSPGGSGS